MKEYITTVDFGKRRDPATVMVFRDNARIVDAGKLSGRPDRIIHILEVVAIENYKTEYMQLGRNVKTIMDHVDLKNNADLVVDGNGVGEAAIDILRGLGLAPMPIISTGGMTFREVYEEAPKQMANSTGAVDRLKVLKEIHVPKPDLVAAGRNLLEQDRLKILRTLRYAKYFKEQLNNFRGPNAEKKRTTYEAENDNIHDDMVINFLLAAWWLSYQMPDIEERALPPAGGDAVDWDSYDYL